MPVLPTCITGGAQSLQFLIACLHGFPESRLFGLIQETHFAASVDARFVDAAHGIFGQFAGFYGTSEYA